MWKKFELSNESVIDQKSIELRKTFLIALSASSQQHKAALFSRFNSSDGTQTIYLTPVAVEAVGHIYDSYSPMECERPSKNGLAFLAGDNGAWSLIESEEDA